MYRNIEALIENSIMQERVNENGDVVNYTILPCDGYKLHEKSRDEVVVDENGNETGEIKKGYTNGIVTVLANYDFKENPREIYARPEFAEDEIIIKGDAAQNSEIVEKARAYDILTGAEE